MLLKMPLTMPLKMPLRAPLRMMVMTWQFLFEAVPDPELEPRPLFHAVQVVQLQPVKCRHLTTKTHNLYKTRLKQIERS